MEVYLLRVHRSWARRWRVFWRWLFFATFLLWVLQSFSWGYRYRLIVFGFGWQIQVCEWQSFPARLLEHWFHRTWSSPSSCNHKVVIFVFTRAVICRLDFWERDCLLGEWFWFIFRGIVWYVFLYPFRYQGFFWTKNVQLQEYVFLQWHLELASWGGWTWAWNRWLWFWDEDLARTFRHKARPKL